MDRRLRILLMLVVPPAASAAIYLWGGAGQAYLAADDFLWLARGQGIDWPGIFQQPVGDPFYRPVDNAWFASAVATCGAAASCYHQLNLALHLIAVALVGVLALSLFGDYRIAFWGTLFFAVAPAYVQTVVRISGAPSILAMCFYVSALIAQAASWKAATRGRRLSWETSAILFAVLALFSHQAAVTLPIVSWLIWKLFGPEDLLRRRFLAAGLILPAGVLMAVLVLTNDTSAVSFDYLAGHYLPFVGFALALSAALFASSDWLARRLSGSKRLVQAGALVVALLITVGLARFNDTAVRRQVQVLDLWQEYAIALATEAAPDNGRILVYTIPPSEMVDRMYIPPILQWVYQDFESEVLMLR